MNRTPTADNPERLVREDPKLFDTVVPRLDRRGRSSGVHVSGIVDLVGTSLKAKGCGYPPLEDEAAKRLSLIADLGFAWEDLLAASVQNVWAERRDRAPDRDLGIDTASFVFRPDPISREVVCPVTGRREMLHASPDGIATNLFGEPGVIELKVRYASSGERWDPADPTTIAWKQMFQIRTYARMLEMDRAILACLHLNGSYVGGKPEFAQPVFRYIEFDRAALAAWFDKIVVPAAFRARREE